MQTLRSETLCIVLCRRDHTPDVHCNDGRLEQRRYIAGTAKTHTLDSSTHRQHIYRCRGERVVRLQQRGDWSCRVTATRRLRTVIRAACRIPRRGKTSHTMQCSVKIPPTQGCGLLICNAGAQGGTRHNVRDVNAEHGTPRSTGAGGDADPKAKQLPTDHINSTAKSCTAGALRWTTLRARTRQADSRGVARSHLPPWNNSARPTACVPASPTGIA
jgi:hypothetical protein